MTFPDMVADLAKDLKGAKLRRTGALAQLAGLVKGLVSAVDAEASEAIGAVSGSRARVYMPRTRKAAAGAKARPRVDEELQAVKSGVEEKARAAKEKSAVEAKLAALPVYAAASEEDRKAMVSQVLAMRRARDKEKEEKKAEAAEAVKARTAGVRAEFAGRFKKPEDVVGKTEKFEGYLAELKDAIERERVAFEKAGLTQGKTDLVKELDRAQKTGKIKALKGSEKTESLLSSVSDHTSAVQAGVKSLHDSLAAQLLGPFAGLYTTTKGFVTSTVKHFALSVKDKAKQFMSEHLDRNKLLAEIGHLRKEGKEVPAMLRLQMMLSTVMNGLMGGLLGLLKASPFIVGGLIMANILGKAIGEAIWKRLPAWMGGPKGAEKEQAVRAEVSEEREKRSKEGEATTPDILHRQLGERIAKLQARKAGWEGGKPLSPEEQGNLDLMVAWQKRIQEAEVEKKSISWKAKLTGMTLIPSLTGRGVGGAATDVARHEDSIRELIDAADRLSKSSANLAKASVGGGSAISVNSVQTGAGGAQVHSHNQKMSALLFEEGNEDDIYR